MSRPIDERAPGVSAKIREFFFAEEVPWSLALLRICLPLVLLVPVLQRWPHVRTLYSSDGAPAPMWINFGHPDLLPIPGPTLAVALYAALVFCLVATCVGWRTRLSLAATTALYTYFTLLDGITTLTKYTVIASHVLLLLTCSGCGTVWSADALLARGREPRWPGPADGPKCPVWPRRLIAILVGVVYLGAAATKMHTTGYFSGDQMAFWMQTNLNMANPIGERVSLYPAWLVVASYTVIIWEIVFLFLCWRGWGRTICIALGYMFHLMTGILLGLVIFPILYITLYLALFNEWDIRRLGRWLRRGGRRFVALGSALRVIAWRPGLPAIRPIQSLTAFGTLLATLVVANVEIEHRRDVYGERRPEGRHVLQPIDPQRLAMLLDEAQGLDPVDKMFSFDIGTELLGEVLMDRRREFLHGERAIIQCSLQPSHEDLFVEVQVRDGGDRIVQRTGNVIPRENLRGNLFYTLDRSLEPGEYTFVMRIDGKEVARKSIRLREG
ncbi:MAG: HTTM domain-containing protein [Planctomyces sp.]|nr:HTTM domain-containing protein [Planctomyces sp.]